METTTESSKHNRELTTTEIKIAIAQIEDRLMRVAKAQSELVDSKISELSEEFPVFADKLREKYDIPAGVYLFGAGDEGVLEKHNAHVCRRHITAFVRGKLTEDAVWDLLFYFEEVDECDYGWVLLERPMGFYGCPSEDDASDVQKEILSVGTRSKSKISELPSICGMFTGGGQNFR